MSGALDGCIDWSRQAEDFAWDGSLRDLYIHGASLEDWSRALRLVERGPYGARFLAGDSPQPFPQDMEGLFPEPYSPPGRLEFSVGGIALVCHFFVPTEVEFDLDPREVTEASLPHLLRFMADLGDATGKCVDLTPENVPDAPIFRYEPLRHAMTWLPR